MAEGTKKSPGIKREVAYKVRIKDILDGRYVREDGWKPNYILTTYRKQISRVNIIGVVVSKNLDLDYSLVLDDGSGRVPVRSFEDNKMLSGLDIGDVVLIIARPREYGNEKYLVSEIIRKIDDKRWIDVRKIELKMELTEPPIQEVIEQKEIVNDVNEGENIEEEVIAENGFLPQKIFNIIKDLDKGDGVEVGEIVQMVNSEGVEKIISGFLREGEIFEIRPGRVKVLE